MNEARIGVGAGATALGYTGYLKSLAYARERPQGRPVGAKDPAAPQVPIIDHPDVRRMLLAQKSYVEGALALVLYCARVLDEQKTAASDADRERAHLLLDVLTPITKSWPSQWCLTANDLAIQVLGGAGYTRDHDVEQHYRDNRLNPIHEGTHGIQALDLLGRKMTMGNGVGLTLLTDTIRDTVTRARQVGGEAADLADRLADAVDRIVSVTRRLWADGDPVAALANASAYLEAVGHVVIAWMWLEQVLVLPPQGPATPFTPESGRRRVTSSASSCPAPARSSICWTAGTGPRWTCARTGSERARPRPTSPSPALMVHCRLPSLTTPRMITITSAMAPMMINQRTASRSSPSRISTPATTPTTQSSARMSTSGKRSRPRRRPRVTFPLRPTPCPNGVKRRPCPGGQLSRRYGRRRRCWRTGPRSAGWRTAPRAPARSRTPRRAQR
ncbi:hypothetical protein GCM10027614_18030 [Micromonospora vulcania]